jgi:hypothetical protein
MPVRSSIRIPLLASALLLALACLSLAACGSGKDASSTAGKGEASKPTTSSSEPADNAQSKTSSQVTIPQSASASEVVASVSGVPIKLGALWRQMAIDNRPTHELPDAPKFSGCIAHLRSSKPGAGEAQLRHECEVRYVVLLEEALTKLIHNQWLLGEVRALGLHANQAEVAKELKENVEAGALKQAGLNEAEAREELLLNQLPNLLYDRVKANTPKVTPARVTAYYEANKHNFDLLERRDLHIIRTVSEAAARQVMGEVRSGKSFAEIVKRITLPQPIRTKEGLLLGLTPKFFSEPVLAEAIFRAKPHVLSGPVHIELGFYVFEVLRIHPGHQQTLAQVQRVIKDRLLPEKLHHDALTSAVAAFRSKWKARSDCKAGYVVELCRQSDVALSQHGDVYVF